MINHVKKTLILKNFVKYIELNLKLSFTFNAFKHNLNV